jgi:pyocin large subunit-like protein
MEAERLALAGFNLAAVLMCGRALECLAQLRGINERNLMRSLQRLQEKGLIDDGMCAIALTEAIIDYAAFDELALAI